MGGLPRTYVLSGRTRSLLRTVSNHGALAARATSSLPRTGSDDEQNDHDDDGNDEGGDGDRASAHGVSEPVGINWQPYSVSPIVSILLTA